MSGSFAHLARIRESDAERSIAGRGPTLVAVGDNDWGKAGGLSSRGQGEAMSVVVGQAESVARTDSTIVLTGESGTGKDVLARFIHAKSQRQDKEMVAVNCGAFADTLFESEFFGCERGAFTGAHASRAGLLEAANGSTLFLDEIGDLALAMQVKLLRFLEQGTFRRIGSTSDRRVEVRVIAATNRDLIAEVEAGRFRADLFYRLNVISLHVPPLRERRNEIPDLVEHFLGIFRQRLHRPKLCVSLSAEERLQRHDWPGNVRELRNCLERACALFEGDVIGKEQLGLEESVPVLVKNSVPSVLSDSVFSIGSYLLSLDLVERGYILTVLEKTNGNREHAAAILGISSRTLYRKLREYEDAGMLEGLKVAV